MQGLSLEEKEVQLIEIKREIKRLTRLYKDLTPKKKALSITLVEQAAYMYVTLKRMSDDLDSFGYVEMFSQGNQEPYERERPVARQYNQMQKSYQTIIKQLSDLLKHDTENKKVEDDGFESFVNSRN